MDRRRFVPSHEGLETRALQTSNLAGIFGNQVTSNLNIPITYEQKCCESSICLSISTKSCHGRFLPAPEIKQIQNCSTRCWTRSRGPLEALNNFNYQLRKRVATQSLSTDNINRPISGSGRSRNRPRPRRTRSPGTAVQFVQAGLQVDTASVLPVTLGSIDYTLTLQTALGIGRPMP